MPEKIVIADSRHEQTDVTGWFIVGAFLVLIGGLGISGLVCWAIFPWSTQDKIIHQPVESAFPPPRLQPDPPEAWRRFYEAEIRRLNSYGWLDRGNGLVHIPINQAVGEIAKRGIPGWPAPQQHQ